MPLSLKLVLFSEVNFFEIVEAKLPNLAEGGSFENREEKLLPRFFSPLLPAVQSVKHFLSSFVFCFFKMVQAADFLLALTFRKKLPI